MDGKLNMINRIKKLPKKTFRSKLDDFMNPTKKILQKSLSTLTNLKIIK